MGNNSAIATSVKLPNGVDVIINEIVKSLHISKTKFIRDAILAQIEDYLDVKQVEEILAKNEKSLSAKDAKHALGLED